MKQKFSSIMAVVIVAAVAGYNTYTSASEVEFSDLTLSNMDALVFPELGTGAYRRYVNPCSPPIEYESSVACIRGGTEECSPSDC